MPAEVDQLHCLLPDVYYEAKHGRIGVALSKLKYLEKEELTLKKLTIIFFTSFSNAPNKVL